ncbi:hypothetical protein [Williamsia sp. 1135]|uniref:hypothetical protein n=1 Tax=Williamsia sp. 1135 TaxID=1889262 RepID=UPI000A1192DA|nr:hypothetical protein [Williamsia sp. 1135]ORM27807.1 hypothetical protein BFL43_22200 [Williamsia sp. 1135]
MGNRLADPDRQHVLGTVNRVIDAVAHEDRWSIARRCTGQLLEELLSGIHELTLTPQDSVDLVGFAGVPIVAVDDGIAVAIGGVEQTAHQPPAPIVAVLTASSERPSTWLVASLDVRAAVDADLQRALQFGALPESDDTQLIAAHSPLDARAAAIDWDNPELVFRTAASGTVTVRDALKELDEFDRQPWPWLADECPTFAGLFPRTRHPELLREPFRHLGAL